MAILMLVILYIQTKSSLPQPLDPFNEFGSLQGTIGAAIHGSNAFEAYDCEHQRTEVISARFSLNSPPACKAAGRSAYHPPQKAKAQLLKKREHIPVKVTNCKINWKVFVGWWGTSGAWNFMHSFLQTHEDLIQITKAQ